jgi:3-oxoadipate enol-lactonase
MRTQGGAAVWHEAGRGSQSLHMEVSGQSDGPTIILSNSLATSMAMWDAQMPALQQRFRVVRYDNRGHGASYGSSAPYSVAGLGADLVSVLDHLEIPSAAVCGLSLGGMVGIWVAAHFPDRVDQLVLANTTAFIPSGFWDERMARVRAGGTKVIAESTLERWFTPAFRARNPEEVSRIAHMIDQTAEQGYLGCCEAMDGMDLRPDLSSIQARTLLITGSDDPAAPPGPTGELADAIRAGGSEVTMRVINGAAHLSNVEQPEAFTRTIVDFLKHQGEPENG